jgi:hypothetical protein
MSHRDRADLGTHLSLGENRGSYVDATPLHLSVRSFRDNNSQSTLPPRGGSVNQSGRSALHRWIFLNNAWDYRGRTCRLYTLL